MSRMFKVLSSGTSPRVLAEVPAVPIEEVPFVEIGDPAGPRYSSGLSLLKVAEPVKPSAEPAPAPAEREFPRLAAPKYLSVTFHDLTGRTGAERAVPDAGLVALHVPEHPVSGEYRTLRDEIRVQLPEPTPHVLWFTAAAGEAGTTSVLLNLAITLAREIAPRVLVVDANLERPAIAEKFSISKAAPGLAEVLARKFPLAWAVQASTIPNLQILTAGSASPDGSLLQDLPKLLEQMRQWYDWVLVDCGVWGASPQRDGVSSTADAVYLVTREAQEQRPEFAELRGLVRERGGLPRGYIVTKV